MATLGSRARVNPGALAFGEGRSGRSLTYGELGRQVEEWREAFALHGVRPGHRVGLRIRDPLAFTVGYLSVIGAGLTAVPMPPEAPATEAARLAGLLGIDLVVTDRAELADTTITWPLESSRETWAVPAGRRPPPPRPRPGPDPALILLSSGSTGMAKAVPLSEAQLLRVAGIISRHQDLGPGEIGYSPLPLFHVNGQVVGVLSAIVSGSGLVLEDRFHASDFWAITASWHVTWLNLVPAILAILGAAPAPGDDTGLRFARSASAPLARAVRTRFQETCGVSVLETYGMTEAASQIAANPLAKAEQRAGSVGQPLGVMVRVAAARGPASLGEVGEVCIAGANVVSEYIVPGPVEVRRPATDAFGWLRTGDLGWVDADGFLYLTARTDDVINRGGEKIFPREIEEVLLSHPAVAEAVAIGVPNDVLGQTTVAYVTSRPGIAPEVLTEHLAELCRRQLSPYKRPDRIVVVEALPKGATGKVRRLALREWAVAQGDRRVLPTAHVPG
jgi:acyl-CoA synthetase (AMP-forming)/AMP-acid ligase II